MAACSEGYIGVMDKDNPFDLVMVLVLAFVSALALVPASARADFSSYAFVRDDGTLKIRNHVIHLYGIHIPDAGTSRQAFARPLQCGSRAALALKFEIGSHFVRCEKKADGPQRSIIAQCWVEDEDLSAYLLRYGWAVALPDAPFAYSTLEKIARHQGIGLWGIPVDNRR